MPESYTIQCLSEALSPITHMAGVEGNDQVLMRERVMTPQGVRGIPQLTGNMLRHRLVRQAAAEHIVSAWQLHGKLSHRQANFLFHGGQLTESTSRISTGDIATVFRLFPMARLLGGCLTNQILPGSLNAWHGMLVCRENAERLKAVLPTGVDVPDNLRPAQEFEGRWQYNRQDAARTAADAIKPGGDEADTALMLFAGDSIVPGACFAHGFTLNNVSTVELGCLLHALLRWQTSGATVGGASGRGHGKLSTLISVPDGVDVAAAVVAYLSHVEAAKDEGLAWLDTNMGAAKPAKPKKTGAA